MKLCRSTLGCETVSLVLHVHVASHVHKTQHMHYIQNMPRPALPTPSTQRETPYNTVKPKVSTDFNECCLERKRQLTTQHAMCTA